MGRFLATAAFTSGWVAFAGSPPVLPEGEAKPIVAAVCSSCHNLDVVTQKKWTREQWDASVAGMIHRGAPLSKEQASSVADYLSRNFGKSDRGRDLFVDVCSYCHELTRVGRYALTKEQWRDETQGMISEGAPVTDEELELLLTYLEKNFGPQKNSGPGGESAATATKETQ